MPAPHTAPRARDPYLDNARGLLIILVVVGHTLECFEVLGTVLGDTLYTAIYSFHMAAFVMISGHLSRSYRNEPRQVKRLLTAIVVPFAIFQTVHEAGKALLLGQDFSLQLVQPAWTLWFLLACCCGGWPPRSSRPAPPLVIAVAISVIARWSRTSTAPSPWGAPRDLPFFVLGLVSTPESRAGAGGASALARCAGDGRCAGLLLPAAGRDPGLVVLPPQPYPEGPPREPPPAPGHRRRRGRCSASSCSLREAARP